MQVAVAFDVGKIFLSQAVSPEQSVNLSYSSCLTCWLYKSIWEDSRNCSFLHCATYWFLSMNFFLLVWAREIRRIIFGICAIQLPWLCLRDYRGINVVHLEVKTQATEPWVLTSVPLLIPLFLTVLCLFHVNILLNHSIKRLQRGRILTSDQKLQDLNPKNFKILFYLPYWLKAPQSCLCIIILAYSIFTEWYFLCHQYCRQRSTGGLYNLCHLLEPPVFRL